MKARPFFLHHIVNRFSVIIHYLKEVIHCDLDLQTSVIRGLNLKKKDKLIILRRKQSNNPLWFARPHNYVWMSHSETHFRTLDTLKATLQRRAPHTSENCNAPWHSSWVSCGSGYTSCWVSYDGLTSHLGGGSNFISHLMLGILWYIILSIL